MTNFYIFSYVGLAGDVIIILVIDQERQETNSLFANWYLWA